MAFKLKTKESISKSICRIADEEARCIGDSLKTKKRSRQPEAVHNARKSVKKLRALARLIEDCLGGRRAKEANRTFRKIGRDLSPLRDAETLVKTLEKLRAHYKRQTTPATFTPALRLFKIQRNSVVKLMRAPVRKARNRLHKAMEHIDEWPLKGLRWADLSCGIRRAYKEARLAYTAAREQSNDANLHKWRKRVKDLWYALRLIAATQCAELNELAEQAKALCEYIGDDHDQAVAREALEKKGGNLANSQELANLINGRRLQLQRPMFNLGSQFFVETPNAFAKRIERYWEKRRTGGRN